MPQLSPMSWFMVIGIFLICVIFFGVMMWWIVDGKYVVKHTGKSNGVERKKCMKWGFSSSLSK
uniref:ATP synthase F0 subunit 8 n=1 Tax=Anemina arcaeformis TaxID=1903496 RepID=A0A0C4K209_9BIVA|nr:ATP synthase F0 subunit 8 [Anodonta arcaeformis]AHJ59891.1 ATP synthase F0 subunit 8 [Anodonta arcaeformis]